MSTEYETGYGKPPAGTRFKAGESGNPKGRAKGSCNLATDLRQELDERVTLVEGGRTKRVSKQRMAIKALTNKAMKGDLKAIDRLADLMVRAFGLVPATGNDQPVSAEDQAVFEAIKRRLSRKVLDAADDSAADVSVKADPAFLR